MGSEMCIRDRGLKTLKLFADTYDASSSSNYRGNASATVIETVANPLSSTDLPKRQIWHHLTSRSKFSIVVEIVYFAVISFCYVFDSLWNLVRWAGQVSESLLLS